MVMYRDRPCHHLRGGDEQGGVAGEQGGMGDVLGDHHLAESYGATSTTLRAMARRRRWGLDWSRRGIELASGR